MKSWKLEKNSKQNIQHQNQSLNLLPHHQVSTKRTFKNLFIVLSINFQFLPNHIFCRKKQQAPLLHSMHQNLETLRAKGQQVPRVWIYSLLQMPKVLQSLFVDQRTPRPLVSLLQQGTKIPLRAMRLQELPKSPPYFSHPHESSSSRPESNQVRHVWTISPPRRVWWTQKNLRRTKKVEEISLRCLRVPIQYQK